MNGLKFLSKRSLNGGVGHVGPATIGLLGLGRFMNFWETIEVAF